MAITNGVEQNPIREMLILHKARNRITDDDIASKLGLTRGGVNRNVNKDIELWTLGDIVKYAKCVCADEDAVEDTLTACARWLWNRQQ